MCDVVKCNMELLANHLNPKFNLLSTLIGLNWTGLLKCLERTFVVFWRYINKTELRNCQGKGICLYILARTVRTEARKASPS